MSTEALVAATVRAVANINLQDYSHSPIHSAILQRDYSALRRIIASVPRPPVPGSIKTEEQSLAAEVQADVARRVLDRRDVPQKESPLCLAVRLGDRAAVELLVQAGADVSLQNGGGWTAIQEAVCTRDEAIAAAILRHSGVQVWARYMRRLPALAAILTRMRDFYMEVTWSFESSVIPFVSRIAPSDTYRIWKRGPRLRADMTLAGFDGFRVKRKPQSLIFMGAPSPDGKLKAGTLLVLKHERKEAFDALESAGSIPTDAELKAEVQSLFLTNVYKAGIDVSQAELSQVLSWRGLPKVETVAGHRAALYEMQHVHFMFRSRRVPGAMTDEEFLGEGAGK
ncbi:hypothetical protein CLOM_g9310 [Closterium sp. NIES-68]|nr:hypothetical protein CLOM_g9310 [Closterium sp. NIES-68]